MKSHVQLYQDVAQTIERHSPPNKVLEAAKALLERLNDSGCIYGWDRFPLISHKETDEVLQKLDRHLTGPRKT